MDQLKQIRQHYLELLSRHQDFKQTFSTEEGQRVLKYICQIGFVNTSTFNPNSPEKTLLNEGSRLLALTILKHTNKKPTEIVKESLED